jgi:hypothetical protein
MASRRKYLGFAFAILLLPAAAAQASMLAAINTQTGAAFSTVDFFYPDSLAPAASFAAPAVLEGITFGAGADV